MLRSTDALAVLGLLALLGIPAPALAEDIVEEEYGSFALLVENDTFASSDRHYTSGLRLSWLSAEDKLPSYGEWLARHLPFLARQGRKRIGYAVGQNMYTPEDIGAVPAPADDRPYAGWLYGEIAIVSETDERLDSAALSVGVVGPLSGAEWTQREWHGLFDWSEPKGWDSQLGNEPTLNLTLDRQWRYLRRVDLDGLAVDATPHIGGSLGNVFTNVAAGIVFRLGEHLENDFGGPPRIRPSLPGAAHFTPRGDFGWYVFAGIEGRAVARDIFLDGNTFQDSPSVDKRPLVGDAQVGVALIFPRFRVTYTQVFRTEEFYGQQGGDRFGAVTVTARF